jgi:hypothetical protein
MPTKCRSIRITRDVRGGYVQCGAGYAKFSGGCPDCCGRLEGRWLSYRARRADPGQGGIGPEAGVDRGKRVFYGFVAQSQTIPTSYVAVIRGTDGIIEWIIDAEFVPIPHPRFPNARVEQGFWGINQTMSLADPTSGVTTFQNAAEGVENLVGNGAIVVMGHSLGSALATYFVEDVAERLGPHATACLFASPRTGDSTWAAIFDQNVKQYSLLNYVLDLVPYVPTGIGYSTLRMRRSSNPQPTKPASGWTCSATTTSSAIATCSTSRRRARRH